MRRRPTPSQVVLALGVVAALAALLSGILPRVTDWTDDSRIRRETFTDVPNPVYWLFYASVATMLLVCAWLVFLRVRNYERRRRSGARRPWIGIRSFTRSWAS